MRPVLFIFLCLIWGLSMQLTGARFYLIQAAPEHSKSAADNLLIPILTGGGHIGPTLFYRKNARNSFLFFLLFSAEIRLFPVYYFLCHSSEVIPGVSPPRNDSQAWTGEYLLLLDCSSQIRHELATAFPLPETRLKIQPQVDNHTANFLLRRCPFKN
jgi:hypothetical protein